MLRASFVTGLLASAGAPPHSPFAAIERARGGRLGVALIDTRTGRTATWRGEERFGLASTQKLFLVMATLARCDGGHEALTRRVRFEAAERVHHSRIAELYPRGGTLSIGALCGYAIEHSDNTAADVLARELGGPQTTTAYLRSIGDRTTRVDRYERELPARSDPDADRLDSSTPLAVAHILVQLVTHSPLTRASTAALLGWMRAVKTGDDRLRAGVPRGWAVADKTGTYENAVNDVGLLYPPSGAPLAIAVYTRDVPRDGGAAACADAARAAVRLRPGT